MQEQHSTIYRPPGGGSLMGFKLTAEFMDFGPDVAGAEWKAMLILADDANDETRVTYHAVTDPKIMRRIRLSPEAWTNLRGVLVRKGLLEVVESGKKGRCAKYRIPAFAPSAAAADPEIGHEIHDESAMGHGTHEASAKYVMRSVTPTYQNNSSGEDRFSGGVAPATPMGSHSDHGIPADAVTATKGSSQRKPKGSNPQHQLSDRVSPEDRAKCNSYIRLLPQLDDDEVNAALTLLWGERKGYWISAYQEMRKKYGGRPLPKSYRTTGTDYIDADTPEQRRFMYEKALRFMSPDSDWCKSLIEPLDPLKESDWARQPSEAPPFAA